MKNKRSGITKQAELI